MTSQVINTSIWSDWEPTTCWTSLLPALDVTAVTPFTVCIFQCNRFAMRFTRHLWRRVLAVSLGKILTRPRCRSNWLQKYHLCKRFVNAPTVTKHVQFANMTPDTPNPRVLMMSSAWRRRNLPIINLPLLECTQRVASPRHGAMTPWGY